MSSRRYISLKNRFSALNRGDVDDDYETAAMDGQQASQNVNEDELDLRWSEEQARSFALLSSSENEQLMMDFVGSQPMYGKLTPRREALVKAAALAAQARTDARATHVRDQDVLLNSFPQELQSTIYKAHEEFQLQAGILDWTVSNKVEDMTQLEAVTLTLKPEPQMVDIIIDKGRKGIVRYSDGSIAVFPKVTDMTALLQGIYQAASKDWDNADSSDLEDTLLSKEIETHQIGQTGWAEASETGPAWADAEMPQSSSSGYGKANIKPFCHNQMSPMPAVDQQDLCTVDNRLGLPGVLHRISCLRNTRKTIIGLTCRIGRHLEGNARMLTDVLAKVAAGEASVLLLGPPGSGKTTLLRDIVHTLADDFKMGQQVMVVDTSCEIAGGGDVPHKAIGSARRMQVCNRAMQHAELKECVQNHTPKVVIVDEIGSSLEAKAISDISQRGVCVVASAHGKVLADILGNQELRNLLGFFSTAILSDAMLQQRHGGDRTKKSQVERISEPVFNIIVELSGVGDYLIYMDAAKAVDKLLVHQQPECERRKLECGLIRVAFRS